MPANAFVVRDAKGTQIAVLDLDKEIILGDPSAEETIIELIDFDCRQRRREMELFQEIWKKYPRWFRVVCLMYPACKECNSHTSAKEPHVCEIARAALPVRKHAPDGYSAAHQTFYRLQGPAPTGWFAWRTDRELSHIDEATLKSWQEDPLLLEMIRRHCDIGAKLQSSVARPGLPTLCADGLVFCGADERAKDLEQKLTKMIGPPDSPARPVGAVATAPAVQTAAQK